MTQDDTANARLRRISVNRSSATTGAIGHLTWISCQPHGDIGIEPAIWIFFVERKLAGVLPDHSLTFIDNYGAFRTSPRNPLGQYWTEHRLYYVLASGEVIEPSLEGPNWSATPALRYYGECDCE